MLTGTRPSDPAAAGAARCRAHPRCGRRSPRSATPIPRLDPPPPARPWVCWTSRRWPGPLRRWGDVEVLTHIPPPGDGRHQLRVEPPDELPTRPAVATLPASAIRPSGAPGPGGSGSGADGSGADQGAGQAFADGVPSGQRGTTARRALVGVAVIAAVAVVVGIAWWVAGDVGDRPDLGPSTAVSTGAPTTPRGHGTPARPGRPSRSRPRRPPSPTASATTSSGSVDVGTVVIRVGQPCLFSDVGIREETVGGDPVVCVRRADGKLCVGRTAALTLCRPPRVRGPSAGAVGSVRGAQLVAAPLLERRELGEGGLEVAPPLLQVGPTVVDLRQHVLELAAPAPGGRRRGRRSCGSPSSGKPSRRPRRTRPRRVRSRRWVDAGRAPAPRRDQAQLLVVAHRSVGHPELLRDLRDRPGAVGRGRRGGGTGWHTGQYCFTLTSTSR